MRSIGRWTRVVAMVMAVSVGLAVMPAQPAQAGIIGGVLGGLTNTVNNLLGTVLGDNFRLSLFDEFRATGTPVWLGDVRNATGAAGPLSRGIDGTGVDVALIDTGVVPLGGLATPGSVVNGPDLSF